MTEWNVSFGSRKAMRSAVRSYAREQVFLLDRARAEGRFNSPQLGPLGSALKTGARWTDEYPAWQKYANELEALLQFTKASGQFPQYLGALQGSNSQRDSALEELRVAYHLEQNGFTVTEWRPVGDAGNEGEFMVRGRSNRSVFVEVKSPGWEGELTVEQRRSGRLNYPKYINGEGGAVDLPSTKPTRSSEMTSPIYLSWPMISSSVWLTGRSCTWQWRSIPTHRPEEATLLTDHTRDWVAWASFGMTRKSIRRTLGIT